MSHLFGIGRKRTKESDKSLESSSRTSTSTDSQDKPKHEAPKQVQASAPPPSSTTSSSSITPPKSDLPNPRPTLSLTRRSSSALPAVGQVIEGVLANSDLNADARQSLSATALRHSESGTLDRPVAGSHVPESIQTAKSQNLVLSVAPGEDELPLLTEAEKAHDRILKRLENMQLRERKVGTDGNCQFRALSDQLFGHEKHHDIVRRKVVAQLVGKPNRYNAYIMEDYDKYVERMGRDGTWGDHITLQAASDSFNVEICLVHSFKSDEVITVHPIAEEVSDSIQDADSKQSSRKHGFLGMGKFKKKEPLKKPTLPCSFVMLSFWSEVHYNSLEVQLVST